MWVGVGGGHSSPSLTVFVPAEECDDEDDPEYNFLADIDEPDLEDYRDDKAVRITSQSASGHQVN